MNRIAQSWQRYESRPKHSGPDSASLGDGEEILLEDKPMPVETKLPKGQFNNVIRSIKTASLDRVKVLKTATYNAMKRLGVKRDVRLARKKVPAGSDQGDVMSIVAWMDRVGKDDKAAVKQIRQIDATCCRRVRG